MFEELALECWITIVTASVSHLVLDDTYQPSFPSVSGATWLTTSGLVEATELSPRAALTRMGHLVGSGLVREIGMGPQDPKRRYFLPERGPA